MSEDLIKAQAQWLANNVVINNRNGRPRIRSGLTSQIILTRFSRLSCTEEKLENFVLSMKLVGNIQSANLALVNRVETFKTFEARLRSCECKAGTLESL